MLTELARQVGLALHNVQLDSALQASLDELRHANDELRPVARPHRGRRRRRAPQARAQPARRRAAAPGRAGGEAPPGPRTPSRTTRPTPIAMIDELQGDLQDADRTSSGRWPTASSRRCSCRAASPRRSRRRPAGRRCRRPSTSAGIRPLPHGGRGGGLLLLPRGAAERRQARRGRRHGSTVRVWEDDGVLHFEVTDDGAGFDADRRRPHRRPRLRQHGRPPGRHRRHPHGPVDPRPRHHHRRPPPRPAELTRLDHPARWSEPREMLRGQRCQVGSPPASQRRRTARGLSSSLLT